MPPPESATAKPLRGGCRRLFPANARNVDVAVKRYLVISWGDCPLPFAQLFLASFKNFVCGVAGTGIYS
jgi:hypothetical protein